MLLVDQDYDLEDFTRPGFTTVAVQDLHLPQARRFFFKYSAVELITAMKAFFFDHLFQSGVESVIYLDADIFVYHPLTRIWDHLRDHDAVVTPHITKPLNDGYTPGDLTISLAGIYNLGFLGLRKSPDAVDFVRWWKDKVKDQCIVAQYQGIFVDQKWCEFIPAFVERTVIDRGHDLNVAYWNLVHREIVLKDGSPWVDRTPLVFFHFSGISSGPPPVFSKHDTRFAKLGLPPAVSTLVEAYLARLDAKGVERYLSRPYGFGVFSDKRTRIHDIHREIYRLQPSVQEALGDDPFNLSPDPHFTKSFNAFVGRQGSPVTLLCEDLAALRPDLGPPAMDRSVHGQLALASWFVETSKGLDIDDTFVAPVRERLGNRFRPHQPQTERGIVWWATAAINVARAQAEGTDRKQRPFPNNLVAKGLGCLWRLLRRRVSDQFLRRIRYRLFGSQLGSAVVSLPKASRKPAYDSSRLGVTIIGYVSSELGLGEAARCSARAARRVGIETAIVDLQNACQSRNGEIAPAATIDPVQAEITLIHINAAQLLDLALMLRNESLLSAYNIGFWFWEVSEFPDKWIPAFDHVQEVWAASEFCRNVFSRKSPVPVVRIPLCVEPLEPAPVSREDLGLPRNCFLFLSMADFFSTPERKNPLGALKAFQRAFGSTSDEVYLVLKLINSSHLPEIREELDRLMKADSRIILIDRYLDRPVLNALIDHCDCLVSLHRSEGFGLPIAEAMYMGKPVIATGWSANMDFMHADNSFPVRYELIPVNQRSGPYRECEGVWADPDLDDAAQLMRRVASDAALARMIGEAARRTMHEQYSARAVGELMRRRLQYISDQLLNGHGAGSRRVS